ncbi:formate dehydrogenase accessory sulfurtransferase FdhD [Mesorhizobium sp. BR1-1-16]|uniref:formate dehydrogenase accessory sulfurtransferase FdhD n=1 Tax=Mesorhizobium sp. BR1-1-16 TaxID=2876653 RepID=UPI001CCDA7E7|nr:formate dehydrogenase accessory sulfurtransferase FdhD [Mesorhizobium sp. BR1-1-16]MBZ9936279.1 formate dehydrogenase accessory sulfurtransferase FdhD [Mesorhizobium sp. BR1-1-16]
MAGIGASGDAVGTLAFQRGVLQSARRTVPVEIAVAITYGGSTHAVLMASPDDLEDFAVGFTLTEGIVDDVQEIESIERIDSDLGIEMRLRLAVPREERLAARRRSMAGPVGCGLCGIESLEAATRTLPRIEAEATFTPAGILTAMAGLAPMQTVNAATHAVHAAAFWRPDRGLGPVREDIGRHNALDKLAGALARDGIRAADGAVLLTSRVSVEMVQKTAVIGAPLIVAVSAPSDLAIRTADAASITLVAVARADGFEIFTHARRILVEGAARHVA